MIGSLFIQAAFRILLNNNNRELKLEVAERVLHQRLLVIILLSLLLLPHLIDIPQITRHRHLFLHNYHPLLHLPPPHLRLLIINLPVRRLKTRNSLSFMSDYFYWRSTVEKIDQTYWAWLKAVLLFLFHFCIYVSSFGSFLWCNRNSRPQRLGNIQWKHFFSFFLYFVSMYRREGTLFIL